MFDLGKGFYVTTEFGQGQGILCRDKNFYVMIEFPGVVLLHGLLMSRQRLVKTKGSSIVIGDLMSRQGLLELCHDRVFSYRDREGWVCMTDRAGQARQWGIVLHRDKAKHTRQRCFVSIDFIQWYKKNKKQKNKGPLGFGAPHYYLEQISRTRTKNQIDLVN